MLHIPVLPECSQINNHQCITTCISLHHCGCCRSRHTAGIEVVALRHRGPMLDRSQSSNWAIKNVYRACGHVYLKQTKTTIAITIIVMTYSDMYRNWCGEPWVCKMLSSIHIYGTWDFLILLQRGAANHQNAPNSPWLDSSCTNISCEKNLQGAILARGYLMMLEALQRCVVSLNNIIIAHDSVVFHVAEFPRWRCH